MKIPQWNNFFFSFRMNGGAPFGIIYTPMEESCTLIFGKKLVQHQVFVKSGEPLSFKSLLMQYQKELKKVVSLFPQANLLLFSISHKIEFTLLYIEWLYTISFHSNFCINKYGNLWALTIHCNNNITNL